MSNHWRQGVVFGKFMPLHLGHEYLINTGLEHCDHLTIVVCTLRREPIDGQLRHQWLLQRYAQAIRANRVRVYHLREDWIPQEPKDCFAPEVFYGTWAGVLQAIAGDQIDVIFTSEDYGYPVAHYLGCHHVQVDKERVNIPVSGTLIRNQPMKYLHYLNDEVASYFAQQENPDYRSREHRKINVN